MHDMLRGFSRPAACKEPRGGGQTCSIVATKLPAILGRRARQLSLKRHAQVLLVREAGMLGDIVNRKLAHCEQLLGAFEMCSANLFTQRTADGATYARL